MGKKATEEILIKKKFSYKNSPNKIVNIRNQNSTITHLVSYFCNVIIVDLVQRFEIVLSMLEYPRKPKISFIILTKYAIENFEKGCLPYHPIEHTCDKYI